MTKFLLVSLLLAQSSMQQDCWTPEQHKANDTMLRACKDRGGVPIVDINGWMTHCDFPPVPAIITPSTVEGK